jgi:DNA-binding response OmpR family regulator
MRPNLKILYMSGYTNDAILRHGILESGAAFLQKPFMPGEILKRIRQLIEDASKS